MLRTSNRVAPRPRRSHASCTQLRPAITSRITSSRCRASSEPLKSQTASGPAGNRPRTDAPFTAPRKLAGSFLHFNERPGPFGLLQFHRRDEDVFQATDAETVKACLDLETVCQ